MVVSIEESEGDAIHQPYEAIMAKGFGIAALVLAIVAIFVPGYGTLLSGLALILAAIGALAGDRAFAVATPLIAAANAYFLSPLLWHAAGQGGSGGVVLLILAFLALPLVAIGLNANGIIVLDRDRTT